MHGRVLVCLSLWFRGDPCLCVNISHTDGSLFVNHTDRRLNFCLCILTCETLKAFDTELNFDET